MIVGGLRARFLHDSLHRLIHDGLTQLGWFDAGRSHSPIVLLPEPANWDEPIIPNSVSITTRERASDFVELGSNFSEDTVILGIDLYADSDTFANHLTGDLRDMLRGRLPVGTFNGSLPILDLRLATPVPIGYAAIVSVRVTRLAPVANRPHLLHWQTIDVELLDHYYDSVDI